MNYYIDYELTDFKDYTGIQNGRCTLEFTHNELIHAAFTVGRANYEDIFRDPYYSMKEIQFRMNMVEAFVDREKQAIDFSPIHEWLDPSEKGGINYFLGSIFSKLFSGRLFNVRWLMHLDVYRQGFRRTDGLEIELNRGNTRPDFVGYNDSKDSWIVIESKARMQFSSEALEKAVYQSKNLRLINQQKPQLRLGMMTYRNGDQLRVIISDPEENNKDAFDAKINYSDFVKDYYANILLLLQKAEQVKEVTIAENTFITVNFFCDEYTLGLEKRVFHVLMDEEQDENSIKEMLASILEDINKFANESLCIGNDGILIKRNVKK